MTNARAIGLGCSSFRVTSRPRHSAKRRIASHSAKTLSQSVEVASHNTNRGAPVDGPRLNVGATATVTCRPTCRAAIIDAVDRLQRRGRAQVTAAQVWEAMGGIGAPYRQGTVRRIMHKLAVSAVLVRCGARLYATPPTATAARAGGLAERERSA